jgi:signal peptidase
MNSREEKGGVKLLIEEIVILIIIIASIYLIFTVGLKIILNSEDPVMVVVSGSMVPTIKINDLIIVGGVDPKTLKVGDIIVFHDPRYPKQRSCEAGHCIVHRIIDVISTNPPIFKTKGDANLAPDPFVVSEENIIGKVVLIIPQLGVLTRAFKPPYNYLTILLILIAYIMYEAREIFKEEDEEEYAGESSP